MQVIIGDIETLLELFYVDFYFPETEQHVDFEVSKWKNQLDGLVEFIEKHKESYWVSYNGLKFDSQVIEWILRNYEGWHDLTGLEICAIISRKASDVIDNGNYDIFPEFREFELSMKHIDLMKVSHFDNKNRLVSLKRLEFEMDLENIEEMPIHHLKKDLTQEEIVLIKDYCKNDVLATFEFWKVLIGETDHPLYKGSNQIQLRQDIEAEFNIPCMNYSNAKIGDEIIKKYYCETKGISYQKLPKKGFFRKSIQLKYCIPKHISFKTKQLQDFLKRIKGIELKQDEDFVESVIFYGQEYTFAKGGLHNVINGKIYEADDEHLLKDIDVSGFYPAIIINHSYYPFHLGKEFLVGYKKVYERRMELKPLAKKDKRIKGIVAALKEGGNCPYGKSSDMQSWLYDKQMTLSVCITGELALFMLIEDCELKGIKCIMANTDGATFIVKKADIDIFDNIKKEWLQKTTNILTYEIEEVDYKKMVFSTVNDYLAIKVADGDDKVKLKGDLMKDFELHKNHSSRICPIALEKFYVDGVPVEETIRNHTNIYDFAIRQKASKDFHYEGHSQNGKSIYNKLIRYYVSNTGEKILKIKNPSCITNAAPVSQVEAGDWVCTVCNYLPKKTLIINVNFDYYIDKCNRIINKIRLEGRKPAKQQPKEQLSLFG